MYEHKETFNGTYGELWRNDYLVAECTNAEATWEWEYEDITKGKKLGNYKKLTGGNGTGSVTINKINSYAMEQASRTMETGQQFEDTLIVKLDDPDAKGMERVVLRHVNFDSVPLTGFNHKEVKKEETSFTFPEWEPLDIINEDMMTYAEEDR